MNTSAAKSAPNPRPHRPLLPGFPRGRKRIRRKRNIRRLVSTIIFIFIVVGAVKFWIDNPELVDGWIEAAISGFESVRAMIKETIQGFTS
jgi:hypothetical protein